VVIYDVNYHGTPTSPYLSWESFFRQRHEVMLCAGSENLSRDFCLFTPDERFVPKSCPSLTEFCLDDRSVCRDVQWIYRSANTHG
jgi:hypothetical protein